MFSLFLQPSAEFVLKKLHKSNNLKKRYKAVQKALRLLQSNPRHPGLQSHKYYGLTGPNGQDIFVVYAEQNTPGAYRIFYHYGPIQNMITISAITPHP